MLTHPTTATTRHRLSLPPITPLLSNIGIFRILRGPPLTCPHHNHCLSRKVPRPNVALETAGSKRKRQASPSIATKRLRVTTDPKACPAPSTTAIPTVYCKLSPSRFDLHRPPTPQAIPLSLLHPVFANFVENVEKHEPTAKDMTVVQLLRDSLSHTEKTEAVIAQDIRTILEDQYGIILYPSSVGATAPQTDGHVACHSYMLGVLEVKGLSGHGDPAVQAAMYSLEALRSIFKKKQDPFDVLPCIVIYVIGTCIGFSGTVLTDRLQHQVLTDVFPMESNVHESTAVMRAARAFGAFQIAFNELTTHYLSVVFNPEYQRKGHEEEVVFPYPRSFTSSEGKTTPFTYLERLDPNRLIFIATFDQSKVFIKFTQQYSKGAHQHCAAAGIASHLYTVSSLPAGWSMVVMDYLDPTMYRTLEPQDKYSAGLVEEVERSVRILHNGGYVHGGVRPVNVMVHREWDSSKEAQKLQLLDFDWAGLEGEVEYPLNVDRKHITRHNEVHGGAVITKGHDLFMVNRLFVEEIYALHPRYS